MREPDHYADADRVEREPWPFSWTTPATAFGQITAWSHPRSTQTERRRLERYAAQAELYVQAAGRVFRTDDGPGLGLRADLVVVDELHRGTGTRLHQLMETLHAEPDDDFRRHYLGEWSP